MSDIYKLQYNGMTLVFPGSNGFISFEDTAIPRNVIINQQTGGTIAAAPMSGYDGDVVTLSNTPAAEYNFNSYSITGATLTGNTFAFDGSDVTAQGSFTQKTYTLTLQTDGHGKLVASKVTGHKGDTVTLTPTYSSYYRFNNYSQTGGSISNNTFTFGSQNATAKANFKVNNFTATGTFNWANVTGSIAKGSTAAIISKTCYSIVNARTGSLPAGWGANGSQFTPSNASAYKITWGGTITGKVNNGNSVFNNFPRLTATCYVNAGSTRIITKTSTANSVWTASCNVASNTTTQGKLTFVGQLTGGLKSSTSNIGIQLQGVGSNGWTATGIAP